MNLNIFKRKKPQTNTTNNTNTNTNTGSIFDTSLAYGITGYSSSQAMLLSTVYRCVEVISNSIASLPIEIYNLKTKQKYTTHPAYFLLNKEPNHIMTRYNFIKCLISDMLLKGNGYAYIRRDGKGNVIQLQYIPSEYCFVNHPDYLTPPTYTVMGIDNVIEHTDMLHFINYSLDGVQGISTLKNAQLTIQQSLNCEKHSANFFSKASKLDGILTVEGMLTTDQKKSIKDTWQNTFNNNNDAGIAVLEGSMKYSAIQVNPADSQMLESRQYNVIDICRFFGVNPVKAFDLKNGSYGSIEALQLSFLSDTLAPIIQNFELEMERKIFKPSEKLFIDVVFDVTQLLRTEIKTQSEVNKNYFTMGAITPNEIRKQQNLPNIEGGDDAYIQVNIAKLKDIGKNNTQINNKIK
jgi:HK97 family phage portal protein